MTETAGRGVQAPADETERWADSGGRIPDRNFAPVLDLQEFNEARTNHVIGMSLDTQRGTTTI